MFCIGILHSLVVTFLFLHVIAMFRATRKLSPVIDTAVAADRDEDGVRIQDDHIGRTNISAANAAAYP
ncbi:hypothetical protein D5S18_21195 [Nocardia panacis]|uniref:Uncharacterized protein n=1 Tax=Nocardia panacis TaxID=2340916 RepID=A0A3A4KJ23_9NOCA|nr:hypothetical protein D5S18_21195 [Nocardia panacis]